MRFSSAVSLSVVLLLAAVPGAHAAQPVIPLSDSCSVPTMPGRGSTKQDWDTYAALVREYNDCVGKKAAKLGQKTKETLENVGETVTGWSDTAAGWLKR